MSLAQVEIVANQIDAQRFGYQAISLTNYDNDNEPQIAAGSKVEIGGALFSAAAAESITGWGGIGINNDVYIKLVVAGALATAVFTTTAPTWSTSKQGWYDGLDRYVAKLRKDAGGNYTLKRLILEPGRTSRIRAAEQLSDGVVERAKILAAAINAVKIDTTFEAGGSQAITAQSNWVVPVGIYMMVATTDDLRLEINVGGWIEPAALGAIEGTVISDGTNVRVHNSHNIDTKTIYYRKLA